MLNSLRRIVCAILLTLGLGGGLVATSSSQASASSLLGVAHTHQGTCPINNCWTWILANGAVIRGNGDLLTSQYNYVLVVCSQRIRKPDGFVTWIVSNLGQWGPFGNDGAWYPYCVNPYDGNGIRWNQYPLGGGA